MDVLNETSHRYLMVRHRTETLAAKLTAEDMVVQSMPDASPTKWHLGHTTWFFETFLLIPHLTDYRPFDDSYAFLFNSYYESLGARQARAFRGLMTRPTGAQITRYRRYVDDHMLELLSRTSVPALDDLLSLGFAHEEQHQELILMDILHLFAQSPLHPAYDAAHPNPPPGRRGKYVTHQGGLTEIGHAAGSFAFDNEGPRHTVWIAPFEISDRLVTNGEWLEFMNAGGYARADLWLSDGWAIVQREGWNAPFYWRQRGSKWSEMTLAGLRNIDHDAPVGHISYYEAAAFALWSDARLPTEAEWELAASLGSLEQVDDVAWQWTQSAYSPYPGFKASTGAVGEYNGKFMVSQMVLRGGAIVTPPDHTRPTYRNFFYPHQRWMFSGLRLARDKTTAAAQPLDASGFEADVRAGLSRLPKSLAPKYFYDAEGSALFDAICETPEYYPTRTETALLTRIAAEISAEFPAGTRLVEFGSGASEKTNILLDAAPNVSTYVPIDISPVALEAAAARIAARFPALKVTPIAGDFTKPLALPAAHNAGKVVGFFPGSTIGNFTPAEARDLLTGFRQLLGDHARLIVGADLIKDQSTLEAAYNDAQGVTAQFNKNLLKRINTELGGNFNLSSFQHLAIWNAEQSRIEMHLVSLADQIVRVAGQSFTFARGERLHTENSHKFSIESFNQLAARSGWRVSRQWTSPQPEFAIFELVTA
ncbi:ergothioneine biosynthesis protein EgtB [Paraburkholderia caffeinilytica]